MLTSQIKIQNKSCFSGNRFTRRDTTIFLFSCQVKLYHRPCICVNRKYQFMVIGTGLCGIGDHELQVCQRRIKKGAASHGNVVDALWALRSFMMQDCFTLAKINQ